MSNDKNEVYKRLKDWNKIKANWDGEGALAPKPHSIDAACKFILALEESHEVPEPMLHGSGYVGLVWDPIDRPGLYGELEFIEKNIVVYYFEYCTSSEKGTVEFHASVIPSPLNTYIPRKLKK